MSAAVCWKGGGVGRGSCWQDVNHAGWEPYPSVSNFPMDENRARFAATCFEASFTSFEAMPRLRSVSVVKKFSIHM